MNSLIISDNCPDTLTVWRMLDSSAPATVWRRLDTCRTFNMRRSLTASLLVKGTSGSLRKSRIRGLRFRYQNTRLCLLRRFHRSRRFRSASGTRGDWFSSNQIVSFRQESNHRAISAITSRPRVPVPRPRFTELGEQSVQPGVGKGIRVVVIRRTPILTSSIRSGIHGLDPNRISVFRVIPARGIFLFLQTG